MTAPAVGASTVRPVTVPAARRAGRVLRSEWIKLAGLRSTWLTLALTTAVSLGLTALIAYGRSKVYPELSAADRAAFDPTLFSLMACSLFAQLPLGALGTLVITSEYATGTIRGTLAAAPSRGVVLAAKGLLAAGFGLVTGQVCSWSAYLLGQAILAANDVPHTTLGDPGVLRAVSGTGLLLAIICLLALAFGVLARSTAGALTLLTTSTLLIPLVASILPDWLQWWPGTAAQMITHVVPTGADVGPWTGLALLAGATVAVLAAAHATLTRRDA